MKCGRLRLPFLRRIRNAYSFQHESRSMSSAKGNSKRSEPRATPPAANAAHASLGYRPLYRQVKELLMKRLGDGSWAPGQLLPSEPEIAAGLGGSPRPGRKGPGEKRLGNLLGGRQGRGTLRGFPGEE